MDSSDAPPNLTLLDNYRSTLRFVVWNVVAIGLLLFKKYILNEFPLPAGTTYPVLLALWAPALPKGYRLRSLIAPVAVVAVMFLGILLTAESTTRRGEWLLILQATGFILWSLILLSPPGLDRDIFSLWSVAALAQLLLLPSLSFTKELRLFGILVVTTLWVLVARGAIAFSRRE